MRLESQGSSFVKDWDKYVVLCDIESMFIKGAAGQDMEVFIIRSKANKNKKGLNGQVYCHGGGGIVVEAVNDNP